MVDSNKLNKKAKEAQTLSETSGTNIASQIQVEFIKATKKLLSAIKSKEALDVEALNLLSEYESAIRELPNAEMFEKFTALYAKNAQLLQEQMELAGTKAEYTGADVQAMQAIIDTDFDVISKYTDFIGSSVRSEVLKGILTGTSLNLDALTDEYGSEIKSKVETEVRTGQMAFNRTLAVAKGLDAYGDKAKFLYYGPDDGITRPFCEKLVGQEFTLAEIRRMDNGQGLDVLTNGGGWNCRHSWVAVKDE